MNTLIELPTFVLDSELELNYASALPSGAGHKKITVELFYKGEYKKFTAITDNMPDYDDATDIEDIKEKNIAFFNLISYKIQDEVFEWCCNIDEEI